MFSRIKILKSPANNTRMNKLRKGSLKLDGKCGRTKSPLLENGQRYKNQTTNKKKSSSMETRANNVIRTRRKQAKPQKKNVESDEDVQTATTEPCLIETVEVMSPDSNHNVRLTCLSEIGTDIIPVSKRNGLKNGILEEMEDDSQQAMMERIEAIESIKVMNGITQPEEPLFSPSREDEDSLEDTKCNNEHNFRKNSISNRNTNCSENTSNSAVIKTSVIRSTFVPKSVVCSTSVHTCSDLDDDETVPLVNSLTGNSVFKDNTVSSIIDGSIPATSAISAIVGNNVSLHKEETIPSCTSEPLKCPQCLKGFQNLDALKEHVHSTHPERNSSFGYSCIQCNAAFSNRDQLDKHEVLHSPHAQVSCKVCSKSFANVYRLQRHMISHDESAVLRKFKCPECEKAFKFKHHLKEHRRIHSGEKPFECSNCGKRFSHSGSYSSHMSTKKCLIMNLKVNHRNRNPDSKHTSVNGSTNVVTSSNGNHRNHNAEEKHASTNGSITLINSNNSNNSNSNSNNTALISKYGGDVTAMVMPNYGTSPASYLSNGIPHSLYPAFPLNHRSLPYTFNPSINHFLEQLSSPLSLSYQNNNNNNINNNNNNTSSRISSPSGEEDGEVSSGIMEEVEVTPKIENGIVPSSMVEEYPVGYTGLAAKLEEAVIRHEMINGGSMYYSESDEDQQESGREMIMTEDEDSESMLDGRKVRVRSQIAEDQLAILKQHYSLNPRPKREELEKISRKVGFPIRVVQVWFQNNRARDRREGRLVHVPYVPPYSPFAVRPSSTDTYSVNSSSSTMVDQPLDLSTKKSSNSSPINSPSYPYDSDEYGAVNLSRKSPYHRLSSSTHHSFSDSGSEINHSPPTTPMGKVHQILFHNGASPIPSDRSCSPTSDRSWKRGYSSDPTKDTQDSTNGEDLIDNNSQHCNSAKRVKFNGVSGGDAESEGQFLCQYCSKCFIKQSSLTRHIYEHSGQRPHKCEICTKAFKHKHHLTEHKRLHSGEKPFQCSKCFKRFSHSGSYSQHMNHRYSYCKPYRD